MVIYSCYKIGRDFRYQKSVCLYMSHMHSFGGSEIFQLLQMSQEQFTWSVESWRSLSMNHGKGESILKNESMHNSTKERRTLILIKG